MKISRRNPFEIRQRDVQDPLPIGAALFRAAAKQGARKGADRFARRRAGFINGGDDAEDGFFQGSRRVIAGLQPVQRPVEIGQGVGQPGIAVGIEAEGTAVRMVARTAAIRATLLADSAM